MHAKKTLSLTHVKQKARRKTNPILAQTILAARKQKAWQKVSHALSGSTRNYSSANLAQIDKVTKAGDTVMILGKVLSSGDLTKKVRISALSASAQAIAKIKASKSEFVTIAEEIKSNPKMEGVKLI